MSKKNYIFMRKLLTKLHIHAHVDKIATSISKVFPLPLISYDNIKLSLGFYSLVILEDVEQYHRFVKPRKGWTVVDVGAHVGVYTVEVAKIIGNAGTVVAIEPDPDNFRMLKFHIALNKLENVYPLWVALGSRLGSTNLYRYTTPLNIISDVLSVAGNDAHVVTVPICTFDYVCEKFGLRDVDLVKIDAEGAEVEVFKGMRRTLPQHIVGEWHGKARLHEVKALLKEGGYSIVHKHSRKNLGIFYARHIK